MVEDTTAIRNEETVPGSARAKARLAQLRGARTPEAPRWSRLRRSSAVSWSSGRP